MSRTPSSPTPAPAPRPAAPPLLLPTALVLVVTAYASVLVTRLANAPVLSARHLAPLGIYTAALLVVGLVLRLARYRGDGPLVGAVMALCGLGVVLQTRLGTLQIGQALAPSELAFPLGVFAMLAVFLLCRRERHARLEAGWWLCLLAALATLGGLLLLGRRFRGGVFLAGNVNPVEVVKPLLIVFLAAVLVGHGAPLRRRFLLLPVPPVHVVATVALLWALPMGLMLAQRDLGLITLMNGVLLAMLYSVTHRSGYLLCGMGAVVLMGRYAVPLAAHAQRRFEAWQDPFASATGSGWQILQGLAALYSGGLMGVGIGAGAPQVVPISQSDFIYAVYGEELGFIGCGLLLALYILLAARGFGIAARVRSEFSSVLAVGLTTCIALQTLINVGGVTKAIPLTGITLPFISHGGSSLVTFMAMVGLLMAISEPAPATDAPGGRG